MCFSRAWQESVKSKACPMLKRGQALMKDDKDFGEKSIPQNDVS